MSNCKERRESGLFSHQIRHRDTNLVVRLFFIQGDEDRLQALGADLLCDGSDLLKNIQIMNGNHELFFLLSPFFFHNEPSLFAKKRIQAINFPDGFAVL